MSKACSVCREVKDFSLFYKSKKSVNGCMSRCKSCDLQYHNLRTVEKAKAHARWWTANREVLLREKRERTKQKKLQRLQEKRSALGTLTTDRLVYWRKQRASRSILKTQAQPAWVDQPHRSRINAIYALTQQLQELTGSVYHVDHIVPLHSTEVCGLHVWWNLQPLPEKTNIIKNDVFDPTIFPEQGEIAFPFRGGLTLVQNTMRPEKVEKANE